MDVAFKKWMSFYGKLHGEYMVSREFVLHDLTLKYIQIQMFCLMELIYDGIFFYIFLIQLEKGDFLVDNIRERIDSAT